MTKRKKTTPGPKREIGAVFPSEITSPEEDAWTNTADSAKDHKVLLTYNHNQQINFFGELQGFDNLEKLSPEMRTAAVQYLEREQSSRLQYVALGQRNTHTLQQKGQQISAKIQTQAMALACLVFIVTLIVAAYLLTNGQTVVAITILLGEVGGAAGLVVYGNRSSNNSSKNKSESSDEESKDEEDSQ